MRPVWTDIYDNAYQPYANGEQTLQQTMAIGEKPLRKYMLDQTQEKTLEQVTAIAGLKMVDKPDIPSPRFTACLCSQRT